MNDNDIKTVNIPLDEYFDLRQKAESNMFLMERLGSFENRLNTIESSTFGFESRIYQLETIERLRNNER